MKKKIRELTRSTKGQKLERIAEELRTYLTGWLGYFGFCETRSTLRDLDKWIRRRLRRFIWKQWKRGRKRYAELRKRGVEENLAAQTAGSPHGAWRLSNSPALQNAFKPLLCITWYTLSVRLMTCFRRTAVYRPVRTVVWQGKSARTYLC